MPPPRDKPALAGQNTNTGDGVAEAGNITTSVVVNKPSSTQINSRMEDFDASLTLRYPLENQDYYKAAIRFSLYSIDPYEIDANAARQIADTPFLSSLFSKKEVTTNAADQSRLAAEADAAGPVGYEGQDLTGGAVSDIQGKQEQEETLTATNRDLSLSPTNLHQNIILYFPPGVLINDAVIYDTNATLGPGGATALAGVNNKDNLLSSVARGVTEGAADLFNLIAGDVLSQEAAQVAATRAFNKLPSGGMQNVTRIALQKLINPNTRTMFQGVPIREFAFTFRMIATSQVEAKEIESIVKKFRTELYPEAIEIGGLPLGFKFPNIFKINYLYNGVVNKAMPQPLMCYLRSVQTTYNQNNMVFHKDGRPTEIDLTLSFAEFRALTKKDILEGSDASGGPH